MLNATWKQKAGLMALGSIFTIVGMLLSPLKAQQNYKFGEIECESLKVTGVINCESLVVRDHIGLFSSMHRNTYIGPGFMFVKHLANEEENLIVETSIGDGGVILSDNDNNQLLKLGTDKHGGYVIAKGRLKGYAVMGINEKGNGAVSTNDKNDYLQ